MLSKKNQKYLVIWFHKVIKYFSPSIIFPSNTGPVSSTEHQTHPSSQIHSNSISSPAHSGRAFPQNRWINHNWVQTENSLSDIQNPVCSLKAQPGVNIPCVISCHPYSIFDLFHTYIRNLKVFMITYFLYLFRFISNRMLKSISIHFEIEK